MARFTTHSLDDLLESYARTVSSIPPTEWRRRVALRVALYEELERRRIPHSWWSQSIRHAIEASRSAA